MTLPANIRAIVACAAFVTPSAASAGTLATIYSFRSVHDGAEPNGLLLANGLTYGTTLLGGRHGEGTLYSLDPVQHTHTILFNFSGNANGQNPNPVILLNGLLFGTTELSPGNTLGTVFTFDTATNKLRTIHSFQKNGGGVFPAGSLDAVGGTIYGATYYGGASDRGTLFSMNPATGAASFIYNFGSHDSGRNPGGIRAKGDILYGAAEFGGIRQNGTIFNFDVASNKFKLLYRLQGGATGSTPSGITLPRHRALYGVTAFGGIYGMGILYKYDLATKTETTLHSFTGGADGGYPGGDPLLLHGLLYGITAGGGQYNAGTIYRFNLNTNTETVLCNFTGRAGGGQPSSLLYESGTFYGTTSISKQGPLGTIFAFKP